jgi:hypothetical protein
MHADMVGHEIEDQAEIVLLQNGTQPFKTSFAAKLGIELGVIDNVVAMRRALARLHEGRRIEMRDAKRLQVGDNSRRGVEVEIRRQLQAVGCDRNRWGHFPIRRASAPTMAGRCRLTRYPKGGFPGCHRARGR